MITGEDYNISPLSASTAVAKVKTLNRASSGISRYFDLTDPTGKYSSTNLFADDGVLYKDLFTTTANFTYVTQTDVQNVIYNTVYNILRTPSLRDFYYTQFIDQLTTSLNVAWHSVTQDSNTVSGYVYDTTSSVKYPVGSYTYTDLKYVTINSLIKFSPPLGSYFDTTKQNRITTVPLSGILPTGAATYLWAQVVSVKDDGTASGTGVLLTGMGPIVLDKIIPTGSTLSQVIPKFTTSISSSVITTMIDLIFAKQPFGLRYDITTQSWQIIFENNLNQSGAFSLANQGSTTPLKLDASWLLLFTTNNEYYTITSRQLRYVFESAQEVTFYFDSNVKIYDIISSSTITDTLKVLSINVNSAVSPPLPYTNDMDWQIVSEFVGEDGYVDPTKIVLSFADSTNTGVVDNPQLFMDIVPDGSYIVQQLYSVSQGQEDYQYVFNDPLTGPVFFDASNPVNGQYYFSTTTGFVTKYNASTGKFIPTLDYIVYEGRDKIKFQYIHNADYDSRIDPGASNIMDLYVLTTAYDTAFRLWIATGAPSDGTEPLPPSSDELNVMLSSNLNLIKSMSDELIYHPVSYNLLFGPAADPALQATFNVMINPSSTASSADVSARILAAINKFFALENWNFGDTFYFTELSTYVLTQLTPDVISFVIVPTQPDLYFGSLFEIKCPSNKIFISCATTDNIKIVSGLTSSNLKTVNGSALNAVVTSQNVISAPNGANN
jgi:hypothetical protein